MTNKPKRKCKILADSKIKIRKGESQQNPVTVLDSFVHAQKLHAWVSTAHEVYWSGDRVPGFLRWIHLAF